MGGDQHALAGGELGGDVGGPVGQHPLERGLQALGRRRDHAAVAPVGGEIVLAAGRQRRRRNVIGAAPDQDLFGAVPLGRLGLVEAGEAAVVALVQPPILLGRDPHLTRGVQRQPEGANGAGQNRGEGLVEFDPSRLQKLSGLAGFFLALGRQIDVHPSGEAVLEVPLALAVADQDKLGHGACG